MAATFQDIRIAGGDTAVPRAMAKRLRAMAPYIVPGQGRFLDCGCGAGAYVTAVTEWFRLETYGIEHDHQKVEQAWAKRGLRDRVVQGDLQALEGANNTWDFALLNEVLEHVPDDRAALSEVHRVLKPGGMLFIFSPNRWFPFETHGVYWRRNDRPVPHWMPFVPYVPVAIGGRLFRYWARNYWPWELAGMVRGAGFEVVDRSYIGLTFENISGRQPLLIRLTRPLLRGLSDTLEHVPVLRCLGVSQLLVCRKQVTPGRDASA
jgi:SAM-dependent methyltransferase